MPEACSGWWTATRSRWPASCWRVGRWATATAARRLDLPGAALAALALGAAALAFIEAGRQGWTAAPVLGSAGAAVVCLAAFVAVERARREPMLPLGLFRSPVFSTANAVAA